MVQKYSNKTLKLILLLINTEMMNLNEKPQKKEPPSDISSETSSFETLSNV